MKRFLEKNVQRRKANQEASDNDKKDQKRTNESQTSRSGSESDSTLKSKDAPKNEKQRTKTTTSDGQFRAQKIFDFFLSNAKSTYLYCLSIMDFSSDLTVLFSS